MAVAQLRLKAKAPISGYQLSQNLAQKQVHAKRYDVHISSRCVLDDLSTLARHILCINRSLKCAALASVSIEKGREYSAEMSSSTARDAVKWGQIKTV